MTKPAADALQARREASLARIEKLAFWLDDAFRIPVIGKRVGIDGIIGLLPFIGDFAGLALSTLMIGEAIRLNAPRRLWLRMGANVGLDFVVGLVPILGDIFDIWYKPNRRNQKLMQRWLARATGRAPREKSGPGWTTVAVCLLLALIVSIGLWRAVFGT